MHIYVCVHIHNRKHTHTYKHPHTYTYTRTHTHTTHTHKHTTHTHADTDTTHTVYNCSCFVLFDFSVANDQFLRGLRGFRVRFGASEPQCGTLAGTWSSLSTVFKVFARRRDGFLRRTSFACKCCTPNGKFRRRRWPSHLALSAAQISAQFG